MTTITIEPAEAEIPESNKFQVMPPLSDEDFETLKADIQARGVLIPVEYDEAGNLLDGHHRLRACKELGIECPGKVREGLLSEAEKRRHAVTLNVKRRHLTAEQKRELIAAHIVDAPERSARSIAADLKVDHKTVTAVRAGLTATGEIPQLEKTVGKDGKARPAGKPTVIEATPRAAAPAMLKKSGAERRSKKGVELFDHQLWHFKFACDTAAEMKVPDLGEERATQAIKQLNAAVRQLAALKRRISEAVTHFDNEGPPDDSIPPPARPPAKEPTL